MLRELTHAVKPRLWWNSSSHSMLSIPRAIWDPMISMCTRKEESTIIQAHPPSMFGLGLIVWLPTFESSPKSYPISSWLAYIFSTVFWNKYSKYLENTYKMIRFCSLVIVNGINHCHISPLWFSAVVKWILGFHCSNVKHLENSLINVFLCVSCYHGCLSRSIYRLTIDCIIPVTIYFTYFRVAESAHSSWADRSHKKRTGLSLCIPSLYHLLLSQ